MNGRRSSSDPRRTPGRPRLMGIALAVIVSLGFSSCAIWDGDRCYVSDSEYQAAFDRFNEIGSIDVLRRELIQFEWERCKINEVVHRLEQEVHVERVIRP